MKKLLATVLSLACLITSLLSLTASAEDAAVTVNFGTGYKTDAYRATYGTPVVDGIRDALYDNSDPMYATQASKAGTTTYAEYRMAFNRTTLFIWCHVSDAALFNNASKPYDSSGDSVDLFVDLADGFVSGTTDAGVHVNKEKTKDVGQFRVDPFLTAAENIENFAAKTNFGPVANYNGASSAAEKRIQLAIGKDTDEKGYWFEMAIDFTEAYQQALTAKLEAGKNASLGFGMMVNDAVTAGTRYSYTVSQNCSNWASNKTATLAGSMARLGEVVLDAANYVSVETIGAQMKTDGSAVRMVFGVDTLAYQNVGFDVAQGDKQVSLTTTTVFSSVNGYTDAGEEIIYTAADLKVGYLITLRVTGFDADGTFTVKPYVTDATGTKHYGRTVAVTVSGGKLTAVTYISD